MVARALRRLSIACDWACMGRTVCGRPSRIGRNTALTVDSSAMATITSTSVMPADLGPDPGLGAALTQTGW